MLVSASWLALRRKHYAGPNAVPVAIRFGLWALRIMMVAVALVILAYMLMPGDWSIPARMMVLAAPLFMLALMLWSGFSEPALARRRVWWGLLGISLLMALATGPIEPLAWPLMFLTLLYLCGPLALVTIDWAVVTAQKPDAGSTPDVTPEG